VHLVGFIARIYHDARGTMHGPLNAKFVNAKQAKQTYQHKNTGENSLNTSPSKNLLRERCRSPHNMRTQAQGKGGGKSPTHSQPRK